jgi:hypothetical protein
MFSPNRELSSPRCLRAELRGDAPRVGRAGRPALASPTQHGQATPPLSVINVTQKSVGRKNPRGGKRSVVFLRAANWVSQSRVGGEFSRGGIDIVVWRMCWRRGPNPYFAANLLIDQQVRIAAPSVTYTRTYPGFWAGRRDAFERACRRISRA